MYWEEDGMNYRLVLEGKSGEVYTAEQLGDLAMKMR